MAPTHTHTREKKKAKKTKHTHAHTHTAQPCPSLSVSGTLASASFGPPLPLRKPSGAEKDSHLYSDKSVLHLYSFPNPIPHTSHPPPISRPSFTGTVPASLVHWSVLQGPQDPSYARLTRTLALLQSPPTLYSNSGGFRLKQELCWSIPRKGKLHLVPQKTPVPHRQLRLDPTPEIFTQ